MPQPTAPRFIDAHAHLQFSAFDADREEVLARTRAQNVWVVNVGTQRDTSLRAVELSETHEGVFATVGLHPIHTSDAWHDPQEIGGEKGFRSKGETFSCEYYRDLAKRGKVVAIGECGLDYFRLQNQKEDVALQKNAFSEQIALAKDVKKPLMIHCRNAYDDLIDMLSASRESLLSDRPGIVHFFAGTSEHADKLLDLGFSFSFGGALTFGENYDEVVRRIPLDRILLETDAPYVAPIPYRGKRNEPLYAIEAANKIAALKRLPIEEVLASTSSQAMAIFHLQ